MAKTFEYDLIQCEERTWHSWENFTETITKDFQNFRLENPTQDVKIKFNYTSCYKFNSNFQKQFIR